MSGGKRLTEWISDLEKLKMWEPLHTLLTSPTSSEEIQMATLWILGTAVQNNPAAQSSVSITVLKRDYEPSH